MLLLLSYQQNKTDPYIIWAMLFAVIAYVIIISIIGTRHNEAVYRTQKAEKLLLKRPDRVKEIQKRLEKEAVYILRIKRIGIFLVCFVGLIHVAVIQNANQDILYPFICLVIFQALLNGVFYLKGTKVIHGNQDKNPFSGF